MGKRWTLTGSPTKSDGSALTQEERDKIGAEIKRITEKLGLQLDTLSELDEQRLLDALLEAARPKDSPLHCLFEWDPEIAAQKYRANNLKELKPRGSDN